MPLVIEVQLVAGRYHAHVWGEAQFAMAGPEWPPSPWRLLRALASAWFEARPAPSAEEDRDALLDALGRCAAPEMWLPVTAFREARYYQPLEHTRALHHDFFAVPAGGRFCFAFDAELSAGPRQLLDALLGRLRYLGRAESRAVLRRRDDLLAAPQGLHRVLPRARAAGIHESTPRRVLCPSADRDFRASDLWSVRRQATVQNMKRRPETGTPGFPVHLVDTLLSARKPVPDGARRVEYAQPAGTLVHELPRSRDVRDPQAMRVDTRSIRFRLCRRIPIPLAEAVAVARAYRDAVVHYYGVATGGAHSPALTGREEDGSVARGHRHLYYLPQPQTGTSEIAMLLVKLPPGTSLRQDEIDSLMGIDRLLLRRDERYPIAVLPEQVNGEQVIAARQWRSLTPFLSPRRERPGRAASPAELRLATCLEEACGRAPVRTAPALGPAGTGRRIAIRAHEYGAGTGARGGSSRWKLTWRVAQWFTVEFDTPAVLSVPVGADAHFGLGQFVPVPDGS